MDTPGTPPRCPTCAQPMTCTALALARREEDDRRVCRAVWQCPAHHLWWRWSDRPGAPLETCPYPDLFTT